MLTEGHLQTIHIFIRYRMNKRQRKKMKNKYFDGLLLKALPEYFNDSFELTFKELAEEEPKDYPWMIDHFPEWKFKPLVSG